MEFISLKIKGAFRIVLETHCDHRGFFVRSYDQEELRKQGLVTEWVQESHSFSAKKGTVRGFHFQRPPYAETKLVRVGQGSVFMVLLDLRAGSSTFGIWDSVTLSIEKPELLYAPKGLVMGMCTLTDNCSLLYKMDTFYEPKSAGTIRWNDPVLAIPWPLDDPILSDKDKVAPLLKDFLDLEGALIV
ncbi:MAG: dTDP-4-dehydrorhamnose 3,5-epimerase family protein [Candidatus Omnitrophota bacterium]